jgi:hypothetical protein
MAKFLFTELVDLSKVISCRLGAGTITASAANAFSDLEVGKFMKYVGDSRYDLCAAGNEIEGRLAAYEPATLDDYSFGSVAREGRFEVTFDGLQATPGTGTIAVGDYVVCGTITAKGTVLPGPPKVCKATTQADIKNSPFCWRVVSLGAGGVGTVGGVGVMQRENR